jgi:hypothetical protein
MNSINFGKPKCWRQFAEDGGNKEQALHYHLFSFELCWHARAALLAAGRSISPKAEDRLTLAAGFWLRCKCSPNPGIMVIPTMASFSRSRPL